MTPADLTLLQDGYRRGYITWQRVREAVNRVLPRCTGCGMRPANAGGWHEDERLCAECAQQRWMEARDAHQS